jgi:hypothetical protein
MLSLNIGDLACADCSNGEYSSEGTQGIPHTTFTLGHFLPDPSASNDQSTPEDQTEHQTNSLKRKAQSVIHPTRTDLATEWQNLFDAEVATFDSFPKHSAGQYMNL